MVSVLPPLRTPSAALAEGLVDLAEELTEDLVGRLSASDQGYAEATLLSGEQIGLSVYTNLDEMLRVLARRSRMQLEPARAAGRLKAEVGVPLTELLHAYRLAGRLVWGRLVATAGDRGPEPVTDLASDLWTIVDDCSGAAAESYQQVTVEFARSDSQVRGQLLGALLTGAVDPAGMRETVRMLRLPDTGVYLVVAAEVTSAGSDPLRSIEGRLRMRGVHSAWMVEPDAAVGLLSLPSSGSERRLLSILEDLATGRIGVSRTFGTPMGAPGALRQAQLARRCSAPGSRSVERYGGSPIPLLVAHLPEAGAELADEVLGPLLQLPEAERDALLTTLATWFQCGGSSADTAERLHYHRNTIRHRLLRVEELTGRSSSDPMSSAELYVALQAVLLDGQAPSVGCMNGRRRDHEVVVPAHPNPATNP